MTPKIVITTNKEDRQHYLTGLQTSHQLHYHLSPEKNSIGIKQVKTLIKKLTLTLNRQEKALFIIDDAHLMTLPAQNCLLKSLEETTTNQLLLLLTPNSHLLLPTIISRCQIEKINSVISKTNFKPSPPLISWIAPLTKTISLTDQILKSDPQSYFTNSLELIHHKQKYLPNFARNNILKALIVCLDDLNHNLNPRLVIDNFFFSINKNSVNKSQLEAQAYLD